MYIKITGNDLDESECHFRDKEQKRNFGVYKKTYRIRP